MNRIYFSLLFILFFAADLSLADRRRRPLLPNDYKYFALIDLMEKGEPKDFQSALERFMENAVNGTRYDINHSHAYLKKRSLLHLAVELANNSLPFVSLLLQYNQTNPQLRDALGNTPLHGAAGIGNLEVARLLIPLTDINLVNKYGETPFMMGIDHKSIVDAIISERRNDLDLHLTNNLGFNIVHLAARSLDSTVLGTVLDLVVSSSSSSTQSDELINAPCMFGESFKPLFWSLFLTTRRSPVAIANLTRLTKDPERSQSRVIIMELVYGAVLKRNYDRLLLLEDMNELGSSLPTLLSHLVLLAANDYDEDFLGALVELDVPGVNFWLTGERGQSAIDYSIDANMEIMFQALMRSMF